MTSFTSQHKMFAALLSQPPKSINPIVPTSVLPERMTVDTNLTSQCEDGNRKYSKIQDGLETTISSDRRLRVSKILTDISHLSDVEKLLLYLKLPTGAVKEDANRQTPPSVLPASNRKEQGEAFTWIKSHFEEHCDVCMPKAEVYDEYRQYCEQHELRPLCNADFGKMMKQVFPDINTRRLGQRGQSRYFYGGLRKKLDHAPPTLMELEITHKNIEIDSAALDSEVFRASCELICEWADKLLDTKFSSVESVAEHLLGNMFVNTKSKAAFTLIAALQDSGKHNLKGSALFANQSSTTSSGDKHKETNILLKQKLHKNSQIQKQKEKMQAMKSEVEQSLSAPERKTPSLTANRKSVTPSGVDGPSRNLCRTPKHPSPSPSPIPEESSKKLTSPWQLQGQNLDHGIKVQNVRHNYEGQKLGQMENIATSQSQMQTGSEKSIKSVLSNKLRQQKSAQMKLESNEGCKKDRSKKKSENLERKTDFKMSRPRTVSESDASAEISALTIDLTNMESNEPRSQLDQNLGGYSEMDDYDENMINNQTADADNNYKAHSEMPDAQTPSMEIDDSQLGKTHVRKLFDGSDSSVVLTGLSSSVSGIQSMQSENFILRMSTALPGNGNSVPSDLLSKSTGAMSFKTLFKEQNEEKVNLNKSMSFIEKSKNPLFMNQANIQGRSAFVPVQSVSRKDNIGSTNQSVAMAIPVIIPSGATSQAPVGSQASNITMIAVPGSLPTSQIGTNDQILSIIPGTAFFPQNLDSPSAKFEPTLSSQTGSMASNQSSCINTQSKESISVVTVTSVLSKLQGAETVVTSSVLNSQNLQSHPKMKFTPIRPKASPSKTSTKESKTENGQSYDKDKRPVSAILKEKRAKEQAEAIAKLKASHNAPTMSFQPNFSLSNAQFSGSQITVPVTGAASSVPAKEVVIIVNNPSMAGQIFGANADGSSIVSQATVATPVQSLTQTKLTPNKIQSGTSCSSINSSSDANKGKTVKFVQEHIYKDDLDSSTQPSPIDDPSRDVTPILDQGDSTPDIMDLTDDSNDLALSARYPTLSDRRGEESLDGRMSTEIPDAYCRETPSKIAKLSINSPYRPESACSMGRDTPSKSLSQSRPESACSFGRETPSGARKRKSSESQARRDFKRLNSTGEEIEDAHNTSLILSPGTDVSSNSQNVRRTKSCTYELENSSKLKSHVVHHLPQKNPNLNYSQHQQQQQQQQQQHEQISKQTPKTNPQNRSDLPLVHGLQSPDINCLEREALIESFPNSLLTLKSGRSNRGQSSSVGVSARSLKNSQQRLKSQQFDLDQRVRNYFEAKAEGRLVPPVSDTNMDQKQQQQEARPSGKGHTVLGGSQGSTVTRSRSRNDGSSLVVSDRGKPYNRPSSVSTVSSALSRSELEASGLPSEPSGLPSDVADWINEAIEKREEQNQSAMSEPDLHSNKSTSQRVNQSTPLGHVTHIGNFQFEMDTSIFGSEPVKSRPEFSPFSGTSQQQNVTKKSTPVASKDENTFTVPKAPPITNPRQKDHNRLSTDQLQIQQQNNQRCHSLPIFASPSQSPVSPMTSPLAGSQGYQRASSISPRGVAMEINTDILSPSGVISAMSPSNSMHSPVKRKESNELRQVLSPSNALGFQNRVDATKTGGGSYLKSMQQTLQKPVDSRLSSVKDMSQEKQLMTLPLNQGHFQGQIQSQNPGHLSIHGNLACGKSHPKFRSRESSLEADEQLAPQTPFSDSGYQSSGPSPILNSTPVSTTDGSESLGATFNQAVMQSPVTIGTNLTSHIPNVAPNQRSPIRQQLIGQNLNSNVTMATAPPANQSEAINGTLWRSSTNSAFIPIQGSHGARYVTPIKPLVTLPSTAQSHQDQIIGNSTNLFIETSQPMMSSDITMVSPRNSDPPPYEMAIQHLQQQTSSGNNDVGNTNSVESIHPVQNLIGNPATGNGLDQNKTMWPFAAKLMKLSRQTQNSDFDVNDLGSLNLLSPSSEGSAVTTNCTATNTPKNCFTGLSVDFDVSQSLSQKDIVVSQSNGASLNSNFGPMKNESALLYNVSVSSNNRFHPQSVLNSDDKSAISSVQTLFSLGNTQQQSVLNIDPSFHLSPHSDTTNQDSDNNGVPLSANQNAENLLTVESQLNLSEPTDFMKDFGLSLDTFNEFDLDLS